MYDLSIRWFDSATVRSSDAHEEAKVPDGKWFSPDLVPITKQGPVIAAGPQVESRLLGRHLLRFYEGTEDLEDLLVTPVCLEIAHELTSLEFPREAILGAGLIAIDECGHSQTARTERMRVRHDLGAYAPGHAGCRFLHRTFDDNISKGRESALRKLAAVFVTETLITGTLNQIPMDRSVDSETRRSADEHRKDEAKHHRYFAELLPEIWKQLEEDERALVGGILIPEAIIRYLEPDRRSAYQDLLDLGFSSLVSEAVVAEAFEEGAVIASILSSARPTLHHMKRSGLVEHPAVLAGLRKFKLLQMDA